MRSFFARHYSVGLVLAALLSSAPAAPVQAQITQEVFGRGRIQYKPIAWQLYSTPNFNVFFYAGGQEAAHNMADFAEKELRRVSSLIGFYPYSKTTLLVYNSVADLKQSNIGLEEAHYQTGGETSLSKNRIELAFDGRQTAFRREFSYRLTRLLLQEMLYGGSLKEQLRSTYLLQLPPWFVDGAAAYVAEGWNTEMDGFIRSAVRRTPQKKLETILASSPRLAGQSLWNYVAERYGYTSIQNILNLTRITREEEIGIGSSLNVPARQFMRDWYTYYFQQNDHPPTPYTEVEAANRLQKRNRFGLLYSEPTFSPDGSRLAYAINDRGTYRVRVRDVATGKERQLLRGGFKTPDQQVDVRMPLLAWRSNTQLAVAEVRRGLVELRLKTVSGKRSDEEGILTRIKLAVGIRKGSSALAGFSQVLDMSYSEDGKQLVFSAVRNGQSDIYLLRAGARSAEALTNDVYDDVNPVFLKGENAIAFASNRYASDSLGTDKGTFNRVVDNYDLFRRSLEPEARAPFRSLTHGIANESRPRAVAPGQVAYLNEASGIRQVWLLDTRSGQQRPITSFGENLKNFDFNGTTQNLAFVFADRAREFVALYRAYQPPTDLVLSKTVRQEMLETRAARAAAPTRAPKAPAVSAAADSVRKAAPADTTKAAKAPSTAGINTENYEFDADPPRPRRRSKVPTPFTPPPAPAASILGPVPYDIRFATTDVVTSLYADPLLGTGLVGEVRMADLLENHRFRAGFFALTDFRTTNVYGEYSYLARRYDLRIGYQKASYNLASDEPPMLFRYGRHVVYGSVSYPLTNSFSIRVSPSFVKTRQVILLSNNSSKPDTADVVHNFGSGSVEAIFDNSIITGLNQMEGTRIKVGIQKFKQIGGTTEDFGKFYLDARHYQKLHRQLVWASRISFGSFFGRSPKRFVLGGVDNWLNANYQDDNDQELVSSSLNHPAYLFYQQFALPMRGFLYKARTGPKYLLFNTELRFPIVQYLAGNAQIGSGFFRNLQLVGFFDAGTAYAGSNPFTRDNSYNTQVIAPPGPFSATIINYRNPFLYGYGGGARTTLLGFYLKYDLAWGVQDGTYLKPRHYFSLGYDF